MVFLTPANPTPQDTPPPLDRTTTAIEWASGTTAVAMFAYGVSLSYSVLYRIAAAGLPPWAAHLWPLGFEAFMASAALNASPNNEAAATWLTGGNGCPGTHGPSPPPLLADRSGSTGSTPPHPAGPPAVLAAIPRVRPATPGGGVRLAAVFAWHLFLQRIAHRRHHQPQQAKQDTASPELPGEPDTGSSDPLGAVRALLARETPTSRVTARHVQQATGLSRSRAYAVLRQLRAETPASNGQATLPELEARQ